VHQLRRSLNSHVPRTDFAFVDILLLLALVISGRRRCAISRTWTRSAGAALLRLTGCRRRARWGGVARVFARIIAVVQELNAQLGAAAIRRAGRRG